MAILNISLARQAGGSAAVSPEQLRHLLDRTGSVLGNAALRAALGQSLHATFRAVFLLAVATLLTTLMLLVALTP